MPTKTSSDSCKNCPAWSRSAFAHLSDSDLALLENEKSQNTYRRRDSFSEKGRPAEEVYCLRSGSAKVVLTDELSKRQSLVKLVAPGDMLGYRCIFSSSTFRGTASALAESVACKISKKFVLELIERSPDFSHELLRRMGSEVASAEYHLHTFCQKNTRERLAEALLILKEKFGEASSLGWKINTRITRNELSSWIGASRETVIRGLADFTEESLICQADDFIHITNFARLAEVAGSPSPKSSVTSQSNSKRALPNSDLGTQSLAH